MKKQLLALAMILTLTGTALSAAHAQDANNPNDSSYPPSNQRNSLPNEPDHNFGSDSSTYKLPASVPHKNTRVIHDHPATVAETNNKSAALASPGSPGEEGKH